MGDMNLDSLNNRWLESDYSLVTLSKMVIDCCNMNNLTQMVDKVTRIQYNSTIVLTIYTAIANTDIRCKNSILWEFRS